MLHNTFNMQKQISKLLLPLQRFSTSWVSLLLPAKELGLIVVDAVVDGAEHNGGDEWCV